MRAKDTGCNNTGLGCVKFKHERLCVAKNGISIMLRSNLFTDHIIEHHYNYFNYIILSSDMCEVCIIKPWH